MEYFNFSNVKKGCMKTENDFIDLFYNNRQIFILLFELILKKMSNFYIYIFIHTILIFVNSLNQYYNCSRIGIIL